jgi:hypothetical protein
MKRVLSACCIAGLAVGTACSDGTSSTAPKIESPLVGGWITPREELHPTGSMNRYLAFAEDGTFSYVGNMYGIYGGGDGVLAAYTRITGTYRIEGDRLIATATKEATWDSRYFPKETVRNVNYSFLDQATFKIMGSFLILDYIIYPADAPEPTTMLLTSVRGD